mmetsp:Transcript_72250/g.121264  ORF Transcript_72250/g.121264 Transcript_72250/m.121264 type:complete len:81 (+) Transcript_72250:1282-1524(+)
MSQGFAQDKCGLFGGTPQWSMDCDCISCCPMATSNKKCNVMAYSLLSEGGTQMEHGTDREAQQPRPATPKKNGSQKKSQG